MFDASARLSSETIKKVLALGRLKFLSIGLSLYVLGVLLALNEGVRLDAGRLVFGYFILFLGHLSVHYSNDYFDFEADRLNQSSATSGGSGILAEDPGLLQFSKWFGLTLALLSVLAAIVFTLVYSFPLLYLAFAVLGNLISWYYTAPPVRMAYRQWGVLASAFSAGFLMPAIGDFSTAGMFSPLFLIFAIPLYLQALSFLFCVQIPDIEGDRMANKKTFVAVHGSSFGFLMVLLPLAAATAYYLAVSAIMAGMADLRWAAILSLLPLGMAAYSYKERKAGRELKLKLVKYNVICFVAFIVLLDAFFMLHLIG